MAHDPAYARGAQRLGLLLRKARELLAGGGTAEQALWELWDGTPWPQRLERAAHRGGAAGRNADRDLDAVVALFETAARAEERTGGRGALNFLEELDAQDIAADTLTRRTVRPDAVRLMTAHRAKGLEWRLVVVAGVQEGLWPDLRRRGSLLEADRIGRDGLAEPLTPGALLAEERRLFYVAATRARERLVVTAVKAAADDGDQPSRFLTELGVAPQDVTGRPRRPLAVAALVAELRATTVDPAATPALREAAAQRLAKLAALHDDDHHPLVPAAHPDNWWGLHEPTHSTVPLRDRDRPVVLSGSALDQLANTCSLQWFLGREVKADAPATAAQGFGNVVHVLADEVASGRTPADLSVLMERLDSVWDALAFDAPWKSRQEKEHRARRPGALPALARHGTRDPRPGDRRHRARLRPHPPGRRLRGTHPGQHGPRLPGRAGAGVRRRLQDRQTETDRPRGRPPPPARRLPARGARRRGRRGLRRPHTAAGRRGTGASAAGRGPEGRRRRAARRTGAAAAGGGATGSGSANCSPPPRAAYWRSGSPPPPGRTAPTAPSGRRAAPSRRGGTWWSDPRAAGATGRD